MALYLSAGVQKRSIFNTHLLAVMSEKRLPGTTTKWHLPIASDIYLMTQTQMGGAGHAQQPQGSSRVYVSGRDSSQGAETVPMANTPQGSAAKGSVPNPIWTGVHSQRHNIYQELPKQTLSFKAAVHGPVWTRQTFIDIEVQKGHTSCIQKDNYKV